MAIRKFVAPTTREAMMQVRRELGDDAVIIANRRVGNRIEILAAAPDAVEALVERSEVRGEEHGEGRAAAAREAVAPAERGTGRGETRPKVEAFQDFVRRQMQAEGEPSPARAPTRELAARAAPAQAARPAAGNPAVAMYHDVAEIDDEEFVPAPLAERVPARRADTGAAQRRNETAGAPRRAAEDDAATSTAAGARRAERATTLPQSHRAPQIEAPAEPAVFRRRPAHVAPAARVDTAPGAPRAQARAAVLPVDIVLEPAPAAAPVQAAPVTVTQLPAIDTPPVQAAAPIAAGHAAVPSIPMRSQAAPIATAARLREASLNAAAAARAVQSNSAAKPHAEANEHTARAQADVAMPAAKTALAAAVAPAVAVASTAAYAPPAAAAAATVANAAGNAVAPVAAVPVVEPVAIEYQAPVVQVAPIAPVALAIETPALGAAVAAWEVQFTTRVAPVAARAATPLPAQPAAPAVVQPNPAQTIAAQPVAAQSVSAQPAIAQPATPQPVAPSQVNAPQPAAEPAPARMESALLAELQSMRDILREQIASIATRPAPAAAAESAATPVGAAPTGPATRVMTRLLTAGFSADVARRIAAHVPANADMVQAEEWLQDVIARNIRCIEPDDGIVERAGRPGTPGQVFALVGPTGVGKTTTVAKLAARFAVRHGTSALGLITLDAYRVAAPEQLRAYGRILGTPVHLAQDAATLRELLATMVHKRLVLIDTCGLSQRDERLGEMLDLLAAAGTGARPIQRVLLMHSASQAETLDDAARAWRAGECTGAILTKLDEAARIGGSLDVSLRHRLTLLGLTNGQRVPEDWHRANSRLLAHLALKPAAQLFDLADDEGAALIEAQGRAPATLGRADA